MKLHENKIEEIKNDMNKYSNMIEKEIPGISPKVKMDLVKIILETLHK